VAPLSQIWVYGKVLSRCVYVISIHYKPTKYACSQNAKYITWHEYLDNSHVRLLMIWPTVLSSSLLSLCIICLATGHSVILLYIYILHTPPTPPQGWVCDIFHQDKSVYKEGPYDIHRWDLISFAGLMHQSVLHLVRITRGRDEMSDSLSLYISLRRGPLHAIFILDIKLSTSERTARSCSATLVGLCVQHEWGVDKIPSWQ
jgi:hypothetical protein